MIHSYVERVVFLLRSPRSARVGGPSFDTRFVQRDFNGRKPSVKIDCREKRFQRRERNFLRPTLRTCVGRDEAAAVLMGATRKRKSICENRS